MKKLFSLLVLPLIALVFLSACDSDKTYKDLQNLYDNMTQICVIDEDNKFFGDTSKSKTLTIKYEADVEEAINNPTPVTNLQKKYAVIGYQQKLLNNIFHYYENNNETFYKEISSAKIENSEMNKLYSDLENLKNALNDFKTEYNTFCDVTSKGISNVMEFNLINYSYELNKIIDKSFTFIYNFIDINEKYCIPNYNLINATNLNFKIDKSYVDIAYTIYLTNFKCFDYSVGSKGISDMSVIVSNSNEFVIIDDLQELKGVSDSIIIGLDESSDTYTGTMEIVNDYLYFNEVFNQRFTTFKQIYNTEDIYNINQYKFGLVSGVSYDSYLSTITKSKQTTIDFMDNFVLETYAKLVLNMGLLLI